MVDPGTATLAVGGFSALTNMIGGKEAKRQGDKALEMQAEQAAWVRSLFNERKGDIARVQSWAENEGLLDPKTMFEKMDSATAHSRAIDTKNLVAALFKQGGYRAGETAAEKILGNAEVAHANQRDKDYLAMAVDAFGRRLTLATAPTETGLVGQAVAAGNTYSTNLMNQANTQRAGAYGAVGGLADAWAKYDAWRQAQKQAQANIQPQSTQTSQAANIFGGGGGDLINAPGGNFGGGAFA